LQQRDGRTAGRPILDRLDLRHVLLDRIGQLHLALFDQLQQRERGELLGDRTDAERRVVVGRPFGFGLRVTEMSDQIRRSRSTTPMDKPPTPSFAKSAPTVVSTALIASSRFSGLCVLRAGAAV
jgi:hypothetical protein